MTLAGAATRQRHGHEVADRFALDVHAVSPTDERADGVPALAGELLVWDKTAADPTDATNAKLALRALVDAGIGGTIDPLVSGSASTMRSSTTPSRPCSSPSAPS